MKNIYSNLYSKSNILKLKRDTPRLQIMMSLVSTLNLDDKKILDIGCYDGTFLKLFKNQTTKLYGLDGSPQSVNRAIKNKVKATQYFFDDKTPLPFAKNSFDLVIAGEIIEHIYDTDYFLDEIHRVLMPEGHLLLSTPNIASLGRRIFLLFGINPIIEISPNYKDSCGHIRYFTKNSLQQLFDHHKFSQIRFSSDVVNLSTSGKIFSKILATIFPPIGQSLIALYKKT